MKIGMFQLSLKWGDTDANLRHIEDLLRNAPGGDIFIFPEMFASGFSMEGKENTAADFERIKMRMSGWASDKKALIAGSTVYRSGETFYNRMIIAFPDGSFMYYDKRHCFTMGGEREHFTEGKNKLVFDYKGVRIAPFICYDLRFPVWSRNTEEYDIAVYVAAWPEARRNAWNLLLRARAVENQCFVAGVNCYGLGGNGVFYAGDSAIVDAKGKIVASCGDAGENVVFADLDLDALYRFREKFPILNDRDDFSIR